MATADELRRTMPERLAKARSVAGLSQTELASAIGMSKRSVVRYEGGAVPSLAILVAWARACAVPLEWLVYGGGTSDAEWDQRPDAGSR